jgi:hypothetical protein
MLHDWRATHPAAPHLDLVDGDSGSMQVPSTFSDGTGVSTQ